MELIYEPWPWYVAGPLIALIMFVLLFAGKQFGMSSNLRTMCSMGGVGKAAEFFRFDWKAERWNLMVVVGAVIGGFLASHYMSNNTVEINPKVSEKLSPMKRYPCFHFVRSALGRDNWRWSASRFCPARSPLN